MWKVCLGICIALLAIGVGFAGFLIFTKKRVRYPIAIFIILEFVGGVVLYFPVRWLVVDEPFKALLVSFHSALQLFSVDSSFDTMIEVADALDEVGPNFRVTYYTIASIYYIIAPILTAGFCRSSATSRCRRSPPRRLRRCC